MHHISIPEVKSSKIESKVREMTDGGVSKPQSVLHQGSVQLQVLELLGTLLGDSARRLGLRPSNPVDLPKQTSWRLAEQSWSRSDGMVMRLSRCNRCSLTSSASRRDPVHWQLLWQSTSIITCLYSHRKIQEPRVRKSCSLRNTFYNQVLMDLMAVAGGSWR
jgi:hypothetical protein